MPGIRLNPSCCCDPVLACSPCAIPKKDLTLSWTNSSPTIGNGSTTLVYSSASNTWTSACVSLYLYKFKHYLYCSFGTIYFAIEYFVSGQPSCTTADATCASWQTDPFGLTLADDTCSPFHLHYITKIPGRFYCTELASLFFSDYYIDE